MRYEEQFKVGDKVTQIHDYPYAVRTVTRVLKRFVELDDGTQWQQGSGYKYPRTDSYSRNHIEHWTQDHSDAIKLRNLTYKIERFMDANRHKWTLGQAIAVYEAIRIFEVKEPSEA